MTLKALALGSAVGFLASFAPSCTSPAEDVCDATNCAGGCCDVHGRCIAVRDITRCGTGGAACAPCAAGQQCLDGTCGTVDAGPADSGAPPHLGCVSASGLRLPGTHRLACGRDGEPCRECATGLTCFDWDFNPATENGGECMIIEFLDGGIETYGLPCSQDSDCTAWDKSGAGAICKLTTSPGGTPYPGGYCTKPCGSDAACSQKGVCANAANGGESQSLCMAKCGSNADCRTPGYACYPHVNVCFLDPFPAFSPGPPPTGLIGETCASDDECKADGGFALGFCRPETADGGATGWIGGYCSADCTGAPLVCGAVAICLRLTGTSNLRYCFDRCAAAGSGQSNCNNPNYVCESFQYADGGDSTDGYCVPHCANQGASCPQGGTCNTATGYCD